MENLDFTDTLEEGPGFGQGFSKAQLLRLSVEDIEKLSFREHPEAFGKAEDNPNKSQTDEKDPNEGGPRRRKKRNFRTKKRKSFFLRSQTPKKTIS